MEVTMFTDKEEYLKARNQLIAKQQAEAFDHDIVLNADEEIVNQKLLARKEQELQNYRQQNFFPPAVDFFQAQAAMDASPLLPIIRQMPKGGLLHVHDSSMGSVETYIEISKWDHCYMYTGDTANGNVYGALQFFPPDQVQDGWQLCSDLRAGDPDFDQKLRGLLTINRHADTEQMIWGAFSYIFRRIGKVIQYLPAAHYYYKRAIEALLADNVQHVEVRMIFGSMYDLAGNLYTGPAKYLEMFEQILAEHPGITLKLIYTWHRSDNPDNVWQEMEAAIQLRSQRPDLIAGFDLVGEEDTGHTTLSYLDDWLKLKELEEKYDIDLPFYFHDGESDWQSDTNLYDAVLLGTKRIGHGFNLFLFPSLQAELKKRGIAMEICPLSNQILGYVADLRTHPAAGYLRTGVPVTLSTDDPCLFGYTGLSYDFWAAFFAWGLDLRGLKKLALNSLAYSALTAEEKALAIAKWEDQWAAFIGKMKEQL